MSKKKFNYRIENPKSKFEPTADSGGSGTSEIIIFLFCNAVNFTIIVKIWTSNSYKFLWNWTLWQIVEHFWNY